MEPRALRGGRVTKQRHRVAQPFQYQRLPGKERLEVDTEPPIT